jgi:hypothetical protein
MEFNNKRFAYYYRPVSQYLNDIMQAGFSLVEIRELGADKAFGAKYPLHYRKVDQPVTLHMLFSKK